MKDGKFRLSVMGWAAAAALAGMLAVPAQAAWDGYYSNGNVSVYVNSRPSCAAGAVPIYRSTPNYYAPRTVYRPAYQYSASRYVAPTYRTVTYASPTYSSPAYYTTSYASANGYPSYAAPVTTYSSYPTTTTYVYRSQPATTVYYSRPAPCTTTVRYVEPVRYGRSVVRYATPARSNYRLRVAPTQCYRPAHTATHYYSRPYRGWSAGVRIGSNGGGVRVHVRR